MKKLICAVTVLAVSTAQAATIYVDDDAPPGGDGSSWVTAYRHLRDALAHAAAAGTVTEIRVAQGTYRPDRDEANPAPDYSTSDCCVEHSGEGCDDPACEALVCAQLPSCCDQFWSAECGLLAHALCSLGCPDRDATFQPVSGVALVGGYAGLGAADPDARDVEAFQTTLSGDLSGDDGPDFANNAENAFHVVTSAVTADTLVDGFVIRGGHANSFPDADRNAGAGVFVREPAARAGGALTLRDCVLTANHAEKHGAGVHNLGTLVLEGCSVLRNGDPAAFGPGIGGGIANEGSIVASACTISGHVTPWTAAGGGMANLPGATALLVNCVFSGNKADLGGGALFNQGSSPTLINCTFCGNTYVHPGGAGAIYSLDWDGLPSNPLLLNCVVWFNDLPPIRDEPDAATTIHSSNVDGGWSGAGTGNIDQNPLFADPLGADGILGTADDDLRLLAGSPSIDAGDNAAVPAGMTTDRDGAPRFVDDPLAPDCPQAPGTCGDPPIVDMGAYEFPGDACLSIQSQQVVCHADGLTFTVTVEGVNACTGGTSQYSFTASGGAPGEDMCFTIMVDDGGFCCSTQVCVTVPECFQGPQVCDFDELSSGDVVTAQCAGAIFSSPPGNAIVVLQTNFPHTPPHMVCTLGLGTTCREDVVVDFPSPVDDLTFYAVIVNMDIIVARVNVFVEGVFDSTVDIMGPVDTFTPVLVDLSAFTGVTRIEIVDLIETIGWDTFSFTVPAASLCDLDGDGIVGIADCLALLAAWGSCLDCGNCPADFDGDCSVGILDLLILLGNWGP